MLVPKVRFSFSDGFGTTVIIDGWDAEDLKNDGVKVGDMVVVMDELDIKYMSRVKEIGEETITLEIENLLDDLQQSSQERGGVMNALHQIRKIRSDLKKEQQNKE